MEEQSPDPGPITRCSDRSRVHGNCFVLGMDSVVATVSGYHGIERFKLIKLINQTGANYVGTMTKSTTHLVCWQFQGRKYSLAKNLGIKIVNHCWFEDCMKAEKRLPENLYVSESGQEVGPLSWERPAVTNSFSKKECHLTGKEVLSDQSNTFNTIKLWETDMRCLKTGGLISFDSCLLRENSLPSSGGKKSDKIVNTVHGKSSKDCILSYKHWPPEPKQSGSAMLPERHKRSVGAASGSNTQNAAACKGRRLAKKKEPNTILNYAIVDCKHEMFQPESSCRINYDSCVVSDDLDNANEKASEVQETTSENRSCDEGVNMNDGVPKEVGVRDPLSLPASREVSCAICWTEFSKTRGVLPCGHRFCYSCIQGWADQMARQRKDSTCPLCKASFLCITKVEGATSPDQKIYSQTIPLPTSDVDIIMLLGGAIYSETTALAFVCHECRSGDAEDCLLRCYLCRNRWVHSFCLDPPLVGSDRWSCNRCNFPRRLSYDFS